MLFPLFKYNLQLLSYTRALESPHPEEGSGFHSCINTSLVIATSVAGVEMVRVDFVASVPRVTSIAIVVSSFFIVVFLSMTFLPAPFHACCRRVAYRDRLHHRGCCEKVYCYVGRIRCIPIYRRRHGVNRRFVDLPRRYARLLSYRPRLRLRALQSA